jgi:hypothetical protein
MKLSISKLLHSRILLYSIFLIALADFLYLVATNDFESASLFGVIGILTAFFSKNMIIILSVPIILTNIVKYGSVRKSRQEGLKNKKEEEESEEVEEEKGEKEEEEKEKEVKKETGVNKEDEGEDNLVVDNSKKEEKFGQDKNIIKTSEEDRMLEKSDKMILAQEKMLERMNKYKPLLDTLNGLTKNLALFKGDSPIDE